MEGAFFFKKQQGDPVVGMKWRQGKVMGDEIREIGGQVVSMARNLSFDLNDMECHWKILSRGMVLLN